MVKRFLTIIFFLFAFVFFPQRVFANTTPYRSAGWVAQYSGSNYSNLNNCQATDGLYCSRSSSSGNGQLLFGSFGNLQAFGIPPNATITMLHMRITARNNTIHLITFSPVKNLTNFTSVCESPGDMWQFVSGGNLVTKNYDTPITAANHLANCITAGNIDAENVTFNFVHSGPELWYADVDNFEIAFDYTPTATPTPTPTPSPTPLPTPAPFLDLPWDYQKQGLSFEKAALAINSYFDHEYPLQSRGLDLSEPDYALNTIIPFMGPPEKDIVHDNFWYSSHDGYDYGIKAGVHDGDPVYPAAPGKAEYKYDKAGGNTIFIDHGNGYQTRYYHLQDNSTIVKVPGVKIDVDRNTRIGSVGATGTHVDGPHIHIGVFFDKDYVKGGDNNFADYEPDGATDPFGWEPYTDENKRDPDPWEYYSFFYNGKQRTGSKSYYLWKNKIPNLKADLPSNGGIFHLGKDEITFPYDPTRPPLGLTVDYSPYAKASDSLVGITPTLDIVAKDLLGNVEKVFTGYITIKIDFSDVDLSHFDLGTTTFSIYSSDDQGHWLKEPTVIDLTGKTATTHVNHLTYFALMAERKDTIAPVTTATLSGQMGQNNWYRSDVKVILNAQDNDGGLGVDYTLYKLDDNDWQTYIMPFIVGTEGHHTVEFYSGDKDGNIEDVKTGEFTIDKTPPQVTIDANPKTLWPPDGSMVDVKITGSSQDANLVGTTFSVADEYGLVQPQIDSFGQTIQLQAKRNGNDSDGRMYVITAVANDKAWNQSSASTIVRVLHDQGQL